MATTPPGSNAALAQQARRAYLDGVLRGLPGLVDAIDRQAQLLAMQTAEAAVSMKRRDVALELQRLAPLWLNAMSQLLRSSAGSSWSHRGRKSSKSINNTPPSTAALHTRRCVRACPCL